MPQITIERYQSDQQDIIGLIVNEQASQYAILDFDQIYQMSTNDLVQYFSNNRMALPRNAVQKPIFTQTSRIFCVGKNYRKHTEEMGGQVPSVPDIFTRTQESFVTSGQHIISPAQSDMHDYEGELAVIIGHPGRFIQQQDAYRHIYGYSVANDGSIRDWQKRSSQFTLGKNWDESGAISHRIKLHYDGFDPQNIMLETWVNDQIRQRQSTEKMIFGIDRIIHTLSQVFALKQGDIIFTGTPEGVGAGFNPPKFLKNNDKISIKIQSIGLLENTLIKSLI